MCSTTLFIEITNLGFKNAFNSLHSLQRMHHILSSPPASISSSALSAHEPKQPSAKDVREDVVHAGTSASTLPQPLLSISIIQLLLFGVCQYLVSKAYLFKLQREKREQSDSLTQSLPKIHITEKEPATSSFAFDEPR